MYKVKNSQCPEYISNNACGFALRNADFFIPRFNTVADGKRGVTYLDAVKPQAFFFVVVVF